MVIILNILIIMVIIINILTIMVIIINILIIMVRIQIIIINDQGGSRSDPMECIVEEVSLEISSFTSFIRMVIRIIMLLRVMMIRIRIITIRVTARQIQWSASQRK